MTQSMTTIMRRILLACAMFASACAHTASREESVAVGEFVFSGKVVHVEIEGGFWAIATDDGRRLDPINLPREFQQPDLRVHGRAAPRKDAVSFHMWGEIVDLREIRRE